MSTGADNSQLYLHLDINTETGKPVGVILFRGTEEPNLDGSIFPSDLVVTSKDRRRQYSLNEVVRVGLITGNDEEMYMAYPTDNGQFKVALRREPRQLIASLPAYPSVPQTTIEYFR